MAKFSKSQTGSKNKKPIGAALKRAGNILPPWGKNVPQKSVGRTNGIGQSKRTKVNVVAGSATRAPHLDSSLLGMRYPKNDPLQWPVEPDLTGYTLPPPVSGYTSEVATANNTAVNNAFKRAGYAG